MPDEMVSLNTQNTIRLIDAANKLDILMPVTEQYPQGLGATASVLKRGSIKQ